jgi:hypothetical protein
MALSIELQQLPVTIASGTSLSPEVTTGGKTLLGIAMPAAWDAAGITFLVSVDGGVTWLDLYDQTGANVALVAGASQYILLDPTLFSGINDLKVQSGATGAAVNQGADRVLTLVLRAV